MWGVRLAQKRFIYNTIRHKNMYNLSQSVWPSFRGVYTIEALEQMFHLKSWGSILDNPGGGKIDLK